MRILLLSPHPHVKGPLPKHTPLLVDGLRRLGCTVETFNWGRHGDDQGTVGRVRSRVADVAGVRRALGRTAYDVLVVKTAHDWRTLLRDIPVLAGARGRVPRRVLQFHGSDPEKLHRVGRLHPFRLATGRLVAAADASLVLSREEQRCWREIFPEHPFHVVKNPLVPLSGVEGRDPRDPEGPVTFLFVGRMIPEKGVFDLLEAFAAVSAEEDVRLLLAGEGPSLLAVREAVGDRGLAGRVEVAGYVSGGDLAAVYRRADALVLPTYWKEGFPTAISEAMQAGLPVVTTPIRGAVDYLEEGRHARFVEAGNPAALARVLRELARDPSLRERMGSANRDRVSIFSADAVAREYLDVLRSIAAGA